MLLTHTNADRARGVTVAVRASVRAWRMSGLHCIVGCMHDHMHLADIQLADMQLADVQ